MLPSRFRWRWILSSGLVVLICGAVAGEYAIDEMKESMTAELQLLSGRLARDVEILRQTGDETDQPSRVEAERCVVVRLAESHAARIAVLRRTEPTGEFRVEFDTSTGPLRHARARNEVARAAAAGGAAHRLVPETDPTALLSAFRLDGGAPVEVAVIELPATAMTATSATIGRILSIGVLLACALAAALAWRQGLALDRPLRKIETAIGELTNGATDTRLPVHSADPTVGVAVALNRLAEVARERVDTTSADRGRVFAILGSMAEGVIAVDAAERVVHMNPAAARILGAVDSDGRNRRVLEVVRVREVADILARTIRSKEERSGEVRLVLPPRDRWLQLRATPLFGERREVVGAVLVLQDVTELRRLEAIRRDFVANVSHELKTPITAIRGMVETILDAPDIDDAIRSRFLSRIREQSFRLSSLVSDLLTLSRLEAEHEIGEFVSIDLRSPIRDSVRALAIPAEGKSIRVETELPEDPVRVLGEPESLKLVISNLLDNALKYTPEGGRVVIGLSRNGTTAELRVQDDGIGIERKHRDRVFQRFYRVDKARSRELGGTGLGLSIVKHVCMAHGGDVSLVSELGRGSTFTVRLPLA